MSKFDLTPRLKLGNFLAVAQGIADYGVTHTITDTPYLKRTHENQRRGGGKEGHHSARPLDFNHITPEQRAAYAAEIARITQRWGIVFTDDRGYEGWCVDLEAAGMEVVRQLWWVRGTLDLVDAVRVTRGRKGSPQFTGDRPAQGGELMVLAHAKARRPNAKTPVPPRMSWNGRGARTDGTGGITGGGSVYYADIEIEGRMHDTQKPLALMRELVRDFTRPGDLVFDGFAGLGTTLLAAKLEGRRSFGVEQSAKHYHNAAARVGAAT